MFKKVLQNNILKGALILSLGFLLFSFANISVNAQISSSESHIAPNVETRHGASLRDGRENISKINKKDFNLNFESENKDFSSGEKPQLKFRFKKDRGIFGNMGAFFRSWFSDDYQNIKIESFVVNARGEKVDNIQSEVKYDKDGKFTVDIKNNERQLKIGKYYLKVNISDQEITLGEVLDFSQDFTWGVLAFNSDQSLYLPGDSAYLQVAVLDDNGDTVCDAEVTIEIDEPGMGGKVFSTSDGSIVRNSACGPNNVIDEPDYYVNYDLKDEGVYKVKITANITDNGERSISDQFEVRESLPFIVKREGPTRIYPKADYDMTIKVKAGESYSGNLTEIVPKGFRIVNQELRIKNGEKETLIDDSEFLIHDEEREQKLIWKNINLKPGEELMVTYTFDAPDVSPEFYLLGPLSITKDGESTNVETREWQIASDKAVEFYASAATAQQSWTSGTWNNIAGTVKTGTVASTNGWLAGSNFTVGKRYLIIAQGSHATGNQNANSGFQVLHGSTPFPQSIGTEETDYVSTTYTYRGRYFWFTVWTAANEAIEIQSYRSGSTAYASDVQLVAINVEDLIAQGDFKWATSTATAGALTTTPTSKVNTAWKPIRAGDKWWTAGYVRAAIQSTSLRFGARLNIDSGTIRSNLEVDGEDTNDTPVFGLGWVNTYNTATHTVAVEIYEEAANQAWNGAGIFALRLDAFQRSAAFSSANVTNLSAQGIYYEIASTTYTPLIAGYGMITGGFMGDDNTARVTSLLRMNGADIIAETGGWFFDSNDIRPSVMGNFDTYTATQKSLAIYARSTLAAVGQARDPWLVAFSMELKGRPTGVFNSLAQKTNGTGKVDISMEIDDPDDENCRVKLEYVLGSSCSFGASPARPSLSAVDADTTADFGDPLTYNGWTYQVGTTTAAVLTSSGSNTVNVDWNSKTDVPSANGETYCLRLTANDYYYDQATSATMTVSIDNTGPTISSIITANKLYKIGDTLRATTTVVSEAGNLMIASSSVINGGLIKNIQKINNTTFTVDYTVVSGQTDRATGTIPYNIALVDSFGNKSATSSGTFTNGAIDANAPNILSATILNNMFKVGSTITATVTVSSDPQTYTLEPSTINTVSVSNLQKISDTTYTVDYLVVEGNTDRGTGTIPYSIVLKDGSGNINSAYTGNFTNGSIDAHSPIIQNVYISNGSYKIGSNISIVIDADLSGYYESAITVNGKSIINFTDKGDSTYDITYVVAEGDTDQGANEIPVNVVLRDKHGNVNSPAFTTPANNTATIDANKPKILTISLPNRAYKVGDVVRATTTVFADDDVYTLSVSTSSINWATSSTGNLQKINDSTYTFDYTVQEGDQDQSAGNIPVRLTLEDGVGQYNSPASSSVQVNTASIDANSPLISSVSFLPSSGVLKIGDTATATITMTNSEIGLLAGTTMTINGVNVISSFWEIGSGQYRVTYTVSEGDNNHPDNDDLPVNFSIKDAAGNESTAYTTADPDNRPGVDAVRPAISSIVFTPSSGVLKIGDTATATIIATGLETGLSAGNIMTINSVDVSGNFFSLGSGQYRVTYTVSEGNNDILDSENLPINISLKDAAGNNSLASTTIGINVAPGVDAHKPSITNVTFLPSSGILKIGDTATATITVANSETGLFAGDIMTVNGVTVSGTFIEIGGGQYSVAYTVFAGDDDILDANDLPIIFTVKDAAGNNSDIYNTSDPSGRPGTDANRPVISTIIFTPSSGVLKIGDTATATITMANSETGLLAGDTMTINTVDVSGTFFEIGSGQYRVTYTVSEGDNDVLDSENLPINISLKDTAGNSSLASTTTEIDNRPGVDANRPVISTIIFTPSSGVLKIGDTATATITMANSETGLLAGDTMTINTVDVSGTFFEIGGGQYRVTYTVSEGNNDILDSENLPINISLKDAAGNSSLASTTTEIDNRPGVDAHKPVISNVTFNVTFGLLSIGDTATATIFSDGSDYVAGNITINGVDVSGTLLYAGSNNYTVTYTVSEGDTDISDSEDLPVDISLVDPAGNNSASYTSADINNRPGVDANAPTIPGNLTFEDHNNNHITIRFGATTTETNFTEYKIFYKVGSSGVTESDTMHASNTDANLGDILFNDATTTTIYGLATGTQYVFNIWAYDAAGNKASATVELAASTNFPPGDPSSLEQFKSNGIDVIANGTWTTENAVDLRALVSDTETNTELTVYFEIATSTDAFSGDISSPCIYNELWNNCSSKVWSVVSPVGNYSVIPFTATASPVSIHDSSVGFKWRVKVCDDHNSCSDWMLFNAVTPNFKVDNTWPATPGNLTENSKTSTSVTLNFGATTTEANFREYIIYYKAGDSGVTENDLSHSSSTDINLANIDFNDANTTTIINLSAGTQYVFNIWAYDLAGNKASATEVSITTDSADNPPISAINSLAQKVDGSGRVDISIEVDDPDNDDTLRVKVEYVQGGACDFTFPLDPTLDEASENISADYGAPVIDNQQTYQVGSSSGWIMTSPGSNTINFDWLSKNDIADASSTYCVRITAFDGTNIQLISATSTVYIDNYAPKSPGNLDLAAKYTYSLKLNFGAPSEETNFAEYKIFYKVGASGVTESDTKFDKTNDLALETINYGGQSSTTIPGLNAGTQYVFNIWAYDDYGNKASATEVSFTTNYIPNAPVSLNQYKNDAITPIINGGWTEENNVVLEASVSDSDTSEILTLYFEIATSTDAFTDDVSSPCSFTTAWNNCSSHVWATTSPAGDYSVTPFTAYINPIIHDSSVGFKWQVMSCDDNGACSSWSDFGADPNFKIDNTAPQAPGNLTVESFTSTTTTLAFGTAAVDSNFYEYKIFYKEGVSGVTETDIMHASNTDANLGYINYNGAGSTTITGLLPGRVYVFNIWVYDIVGNKANASEVNMTTNKPPVGEFVSVAQRTNGSGIVDISIDVDDGNLQDSRARIDYVAGADCNFSSPLDPTLDETDANATSTNGDAKIENDNVYQIGNSSGWISIAGATTTVNFDWFSKTDLPSADGIYCLRLTANDNIEDDPSPATTTITIDNKVPTAPGNLSFYKRTGTSLTLSFGATTTETHFAYYKIFYREGTLTVDENSIPHNDSNLNDILFNGKATTSIYGLKVNTQYSFKIYAYDIYGNKNSSGQVTFNTNAYPTGVFNSVAQKTNGSGVVDISIEAYDLNGDNLTAKLEYILGTDCSGVFSKPTLDETDINITADHGDPDINNANDYQVGTSGAPIITSSGSNTVNFDWLSDIDLNGESNIYCLRLTVNDGFDNQLVLATTTITIDNLDPVAPGDMVDLEVTGLSVKLSLTPGSDANFSQYKIFYKEGLSGVTESGTAFTQLDDYNLGDENFNGVSSTTISGIKQLTDYVFNIWIYDDYGNKASATNEVATTTLEVPSATWREEEDTPDPTAGTHIGRNTPLRVRISIVNTGDWLAEEYHYRLEYGVKNGTCAAVSAWTAVPATSTTEHFEMVESIYFVDGEPTTAKFNNTEGYLFVPGSILQKQTPMTASTTLYKNEYTEIEYTIQATASSTAGATYCFRVTDNGTLLDNYEQYPELSLAPLPTATFVSAYQRNDASEIVDISIEVTDVNGDPSRVRIDYEIGTSCDFTVPLDPNLDETDANITALYGDPDIQNTSLYQIGTGTGKIITQYGTNTVNFDWPTLNNLSDADDIYCLRITANDWFDDQAEPATTTVVIDHVVPTPIGDLTLVSKTSNSVKLAFGTSTFDTNFRDYRIYYKEGSSGVTESDSLWGPIKDANLGYMDFNGATTTTVTGLEVNKQYVFKIWAYDEYGHKVSSQNEVVTTISYFSESENWRWYYDHSTSTPVHPMADEDTTPSDVTAGSTIKLRFAMRETENITGLNVKMRLQYSTFSDFSEDVNFVGEMGSSTALWTYDNGIDQDDARIEDVLLSGVSLGATHNESGISTSTFDHLAGTVAEWEFTIRNNEAPVGVTYYFRAYDNTNVKPILKASGFIYPSVVTQSGSLSYTVSGFSSGQTTEGVTTNITTAADEIPFGILTSGNDVIGAHRLNISTNAGNGYQLFVLQRQSLLSNNGADIDPVSGTNESPVSWPANPSPSAFGYHTGDDTLSGGFSSRFAPDDTYAQIETNMKEISYSEIPVSGEIVDVVYRVEVDELQEAGEYGTEIMYILVPTFY